MNNKSVLFRKQFFDERSSSLCGNVLVTVHTELKYFSIICFVLLCLFVIFVSQLNIARKSLVSGYIDFEDREPQAQITGKNSSPDPLVVNYKFNPDKLIANIFVQSNNIGSMYIGQEIELRFRAYPYQKFGVLKAKVARITGEYISYDTNGEIQKKQSLNTDPLYRVVLKLPPVETVKGNNQFKIMPGMKVDATITSEKIRLVDGLLN